MPSMYEIYDRHANEYDALIVHEDHESHLHDTLRNRIDWRGAVVVEAGIGTGRVTRSYIDLAGEVFGFDRSAHMLEQAARNLAPWAGRIHLDTAEHRALPVPDAVADIFIEGWAFGHVAVDRPDEPAVVIREVVGEAVRVTREGGTVILIETLGTNTDNPTPPLPALSEFYQRLEQAGFAREVIRTDYRFDSPEQAAELCGFFFGDAMRASVWERVNRRQAGRTEGVTASDTVARPPRDGVIVPEFAGMWVRRST
jgi:ubiquinone/menaquinone biosynthesis C-methylase UbiE